MFTSFTKNTAANWDKMMQYPEKLFKFAGKDKRSKRPLKSALPDPRIGIPNFR